MSQTDRQQRNIGADSAADFIDDNYICRLIAAAGCPDKAQVCDIIARSLAIETLTPEQAMTLIRVSDPELRAEMRQAALAVKRTVYDNRIVTFAPLYLANHCVNNCLYCGFRRDNLAAQRRVLTAPEIRREVEVLAGAIGHKRVIAVYGEHPQTGIDYIVDSLKTIYDVRVKTRRGCGQIRRVNVNAAPMPVADLRRLRAAGIGTYQVFQETYHHRSYRRLHPAGTPKADYSWRLYAAHRAFAAGIDDVGIGALFGLFDWRFEVLAIVTHARELEQRFGNGPHTLSFPRLEPAAAPYPAASPYRVRDDDFKHILTVLRLSVPHAGMIITARETAAMRRYAISCGCTQTDASSRIEIGGYAQAAAEQRDDRQQFILGDTRSLDEVIREYADMGYITSFCTAGYRCGRTGACMLNLLKTGQEGVFCKLNAILTFREWLDDFASPQTIAIGEQVIEKELAQARVRLPGFYDRLRELYDKTAAGERDLFF